MSKHTPAPWIVKGGANTLCVTDKDSAYIVDRFELGGRSYREHEANAHLIAASPEMYTILRRLARASSSITLWELSGEAQEILDKIETRLPVATGA